MTRLRRFHPGDAAPTRQVFVEAVMTGAAGRYSEEERRAWVPDPSLPADWGPWLGSHLTWVAEEPDGTLSGFMMLERSGYVNMTYVRPDRMGTGLADRLYENILADARALGLERLTVVASRYAQGFFRRHGWRLAPEITGIASLDPRQGPNDNPVNRAMVLDRVPAGRAARQAGRNEGKDSPR